MNTPYPDKVEKIVASDNFIHSLDEDQKLKIVEEISKKQPHLLSEACMLRQLKVPDAKIEVILNFLLIVYDYFTERGKTKLPVVTKEVILKVRENVKWFAKLLEKEGPQEGVSLMLKGFNAYPKLEALVCLTSLLRDDVFKADDDGNGYCLFVGRVILDCFVRVVGD